MRSLLAGNGLIIQYGGLEYLNSKIIERAIDNIRSGNFPNNLYPKECAELILALQREHQLAQRGKYDEYAYSSFDKSSLEDFKERYPQARGYQVGEIGFEDYFLLFELVYNMQKIGNPDRFNCRGTFRRMFLDSIFNNGEIEKVYERFPSLFQSWLRGFDTIFTTNYDSNIDAVCDANVYHLHGAFNTLSETYDPSSFRNQLKDDLLDGEKIDPSYPHLYSNCLVSYVGDLKTFSMNQSSHANNAMEKYVSGYKNDPTIRKQIEEMDESNDLTRRLKEAILLKVNDQSLVHEEQYPHNKLAQISGSLQIVGLSPKNDGHLFSQILENENLTEIIFCYYGEEEAAYSKKLFASKSLQTKDVRELWSEMEAT